MLAGKDGIWSEVGKPVFRGDPLTSDLVIRTITSGPWCGGISIRPHDLFPRWNLVVSLDGATRMFDEHQEGVMGTMIKETPSFAAYKGSQPSPDEPMYSLNDLRQAVKLNLTCLGALSAAKDKPWSKIWEEMI